MEKNSEDYLIDLIQGDKPLMPLEMIWQPKEDITAHELAMCLPYLFGGAMLLEVDESEPHLRHFKIVDHNA